MMELLGLFPWKTLCGRSLSRASPLMPAASSSFLASFDVFPFIRASVWARKLAIRIWNKEKIHHNDKMHNNTHHNTIFQHVIHHFWWRFTPLCKLSVEKFFLVTGLLANISVSLVLPYFQHTFKRETHKIECNVKAHLMMHIISDWVLRLSRYEEVSWNHTSPYKKRNKYDNQIRLKEGFHTLESKKKKKIPVEVVLVLFSVVKYPQQSVISV